MNQFSYKIYGMDCAEEVSVLKREIGSLVGGEDRLEFDILRGSMTVREPSASISRQDIINAVNRTGMRATPWAIRMEVRATAVSGARSCASC